MTEFVSEVLVLGRESTGEFDARVSLFTRRYGKLVAKAKSIRKITSKLSGHLQPGTFARARFIEKNGLQVADALKYGFFNSSRDNLRILDKIIPEAEPDIGLWAELASGGLRWRTVLKILGWDPNHALCASCGAKEIVSFGPSEQEFLCKECALKLDRNKLLYI